MPYSYTDGDGFMALSQSPAGAPHLMGPALRQIKAFLRDPVAGIAGVLSPTGGIKIRSGTRQEMLTTISPEPGILFYVTSEFSLFTFDVVTSTWVLLAVSMRAGLPGQVLINTQEDSGPAKFAYPEVYLSTSGLVTWFERFIQEDSVTPFVEGDSYFIVPITRADGSPPDNYIELTADTYEIKGYVTIKIENEEAVGSPQTYAKLSLYNATTDQDVLFFSSYMGELDTFNKRKQDTIPISGIFEVTGVHSFALHYQSNEPPQAPSEFQTPNVFAHLLVRSIQTQL